MQEEPKEKSEGNHKCIICGKSNTEEIGFSENSYGEFVTICYCKDCDLEFELKK